MAEEFIPLEIELADKHEVRHKTTKQSLVSAIQRNIVHMNNIKEEEEYLHNHRSIANMTQSPTESKPLNPSLTQSSGQFFREDSGRISVDQIGSKYKAKPHSVIFRPKMFLKYFIIRLIFNHLGPLILLYGLFSQQWLNFCKNLGYWGFSKRIIYTYARLIQNIAIILCFIFFPFNECTNYYIYMYVITNLLECAAISIKLSFYHLSKQNLIWKYDMDQVGNYVEKCVAADQWVIQSEETIQEELKSSMERQQVEETSFVCFFMIDPHEDMRKRIDGAQFMTEHYNEQNQKFIGDAQLMMKEVIKFANNNDCWKKYLFLALVLSILRLSINVVFEQVYDHEIDPILNILVKAQSLFYYFVVISMMLFTYRDLNTKVFCLSQISHLVSGQKVEAYEETKLFPTLNLLCITSLVSWVNMRKIFLDYGLQFTKRLTYMVSFIMILNLLSVLACFILFYLKLTSIFSTFFVSIDFIIVAIFFIMIVLQGARINDHFGIHKGLLRKNLFVLQQLAIQAFITPEYQFTPTDYIFKALSEIITAVKEKGYIEEDQLQSYITFALSSIENVYNDLNFYEKDRPYTVLGIAMTYQLVLSIVLSVGGVVITWLFNMFVLQK